MKLGQKISKYLRDKENLKDLVILVLFSLGIKAIGLVVIKQVFQILFLNDLFGFNNVQIQYNYCLHTPMIIFVISTLSIGFLFDKYILSTRYDMTQRKIFWVLLVLMVLSEVIGHYRVVDLSVGFDEEFFNSFKWMICY